MSDPLCSVSGRNMRHAAVDPGEGREPARTLCGLSINYRNGWWMRDKANRPIECRRCLKHGVEKGEKP